MAFLKPFKAVRPRPERAIEVAAPPYDVVGFEEAVNEIKNKPYSFLRIEKSEIEFPAGTDLESEAIYIKARDNLDKFIEENVYIQDPENTYYIYRQTVGGRSQTGLVGCVSIRDYVNGVIKKHEKTIVARENEGIKRVDRCDANTSPVFLTYRTKPEITEITEAWKNSRKPVYDFESGGSVENSVWIVDDHEVVEKLSGLFAGVESLYIADGHHRAASAVEVGLKRKKSSPDFNGTEEFNYFLAALFPCDELKIMGYNRVIKDLNGLTEDEFIAEVEKNFVVEPTGDLAYAPDSPGKFGMFLGGKRYKLTAKSAPPVEDGPVASLDVSILGDRLIAPVLGVRDPKRDDRIDFVGGAKGTEELERRTRTDMRVAFSLFPVSVEKLMEVADAGEIMPPKSTWFEPKPLSGLLVHRFK